MPDADPDAVRAYYDRIDAEAYDAVFELFAEDVTYDRPGQTTLDGLAEFERFYREERPLTDGDHEIRDLVVDGDTVAVRGRFSGVQNGTEVSFSFADFHRFEDGEIVERWTYTDRDTV